MKIIDLHCDTIGRLVETKESLFKNQGHFDLQIARKAGLVLQFFSLFLHPNEQGAALKGILQQQIDQRLQRHKARTEEQIRDVRARRSSLSGYYNAEVARRPHYVDARK